MTHQSLRHFPSSRHPWDAGRAQQVIDDIVQRTAAWQQEHGTWLVHPLDDSAPPGLYLGTSGIIWSLEALRADGVAVPLLDARTLLHQELDEIAAMKLPPPLAAHAPWLIGGAAPTRMLLAMLGEDDHLDAIHIELSKNTVLPCRELMWGMAGSMLAASHLHRWTGEARWATLYQTQAEALLADAQPGTGLLWDVDLYGRVQPMLGLVHGMAGNLAALAAGKALLADATWARVVSGAVSTALETAVRVDGHANWPAVVGKDPHKVYACHGASGVLLALGRLPEGPPQFEQLLLEAGALIWDAGPIRKGASLCHGTAGSALALLVLHERTRDARWLERARTMMMDAIDQYTRSLQLFQVPRFSLWTGDLGLALVLRDCICARARLPTVETFFFS